MQSNETTLNITLNVGGELFQTSFDTLVKSRYFQGEFRIKNKTRESEPFTLKIDRSPRIFKHVLDLLRDPTYAYPKQYLAELTYFGIGEPIIESPNFVKLNDSEMLNIECVKYIRYDEHNDIYNMYLSSKEGDSYSIIGVYPYTNLYNCLRNKIKTLNLTPDIESKRYNFITNSEGTLFLNWSQIKYIEYDPDTNIFDIHFSVHLHSRRFFTVKSDATLHSYLSNKLNTSFTMDQKDTFIRFSEKTILNLNSVKYIIFNKDTGFEMYLSSTLNKKYCNIVPSETSLYDYLMIILNSPKKIPTIRDSSYKYNFVGLDNETILNWNHIKYIIYDNDSKFLRMYFSPPQRERKMVAQTTTTSILRGYLCNKLKTLEIPDFISVKSEPNIYRFNDSILLNWVGY